jgi:hypothetical protein
VERTAHDELEAVLSKGLGPQMQDAKKTQGEQDQRTKMCSYTGVCQMCFGENLTA